MSERFVANPEIVFRQEEDEAILFDPNSGGIMLLNETGAFIYELLDGRRSREQIIDLLLERYDIIDRDQVEKDFDAFLQRMQEARLVGEISS